MSNRLATIEKIFPDYFNRFEIPTEAKEQVIAVYRACRSGKCDKESFLNSYEEHGFVLDPTIEENNPSQVSVSTCEKVKEIKRFAFLDSDMHIPYAIAKGKTNPQYGIAQRTSERTGRKTSHVDYWLYNGATPWLDFSLIDDFEAYYKRIKEAKNVE